MAVNFLQPTLSINPRIGLPPPLSASLSSRRRPRPFSFSSKSSAQMEYPQDKFKEFPYVSAPHKALMVDLVSAVETRLSSSLLPSSLPPDVQFFQNSAGTAQGTLHVRSGSASSPVDFILGSWLHCKLPSGGALNITSLSGYLKPLTDAPNFLFDMIQSSPTSFVLILDLSPRKDLALHPEYLTTFYEDTKLDSYRQSLDGLPEVKPYFSPSLYIRAFISPTAVLVRIETEAGDTTRAEEIIQDHVSPIAKEFMNIWLDSCVGAEREVGQAEIPYLEKRDQIIKNKTIEIDLGSSLPRLFGQEVASRVLGVLRDIYKA